MNRKCMVSLILGMVFVADLSGAVSAQGSPPNLPTRNLSNRIEYPNVAVAFAAITSKPGAIASTEAGWTIVSVPSSDSMWSFTPANYLAYPAVVKRTFVKTHSGFRIDMDILCEDKESSCEKLKVEFLELNSRLQEDLFFGE